jgi:uncharacterized protein (DUF697 family)
MDNSSLSNLLLGILIIGFLIILFLTVLIIVIALFAFRWFQRLTTPDVTELQQRFARMQAANPQVPVEVLVQQIIRQQALRSGIVGAVTGIGGFVTLPIALPIDLILSMSLQAAMIRFIATLYGHGNPDSQEAKLQTYLVMSGGTEVSGVSFRLIMRLVVRMLGESLAHLVPIFGAVVGFGINYAMAQATGKIAMRWYSGAARAVPEVPTRRRLR